MKMRKMWMVTFLFAFALCLPAMVGATVYDLKSDWSNANNPNGPWSFWQGSVALFHVDNWSSPGQDAWARAESGLGHVPAWLKAETAFGGGLFAVDDILFHATSTWPSSYGDGEGYVKWTSPINGSVTITGGVFTGYYSTFGSSRSSDWNVFLNGVSLDSGWVDYSGSHDGENFAIPLSYNVNAGDTIIFQAQTRSPSQYSWLIGVNLKIDLQPTQSIPEPYTLWLLGSGLLGLACFKRFKK